MVRNSLEKNASTWLIMNLRVKGWLERKKYTLLGQRLNYHLALVKMTVTHGCPAKAYHMMGKACFQPTITVKYTLPSSNRHARTRTASHVHLHTCSHLLSVLRDACWVHTLNKSRISTIKLSAGTEAIPNHTPLSLHSPHPLIKFWLNYTIILMTKFTRM